MDLDSHISASMNIFGKDSEAVHIWLDESYQDYSFGGKNEHYGSVEYHRIERHHKQALAEQYGQKSFKYKVGCLHVLIDFVSHYGIAVVPKDRDECLFIIDEYFSR